MKHHFINIPDLGVKKMVLIGDDNVEIAHYTWEVIRSVISRHHYKESGGVSLKVLAIRMLMAYVQDTYGWRPGLKDSKMAVENTDNFPVK